MTATDVAILAPEDVDRIVALERRSFIPPLQADAETVRKRFQLGHIMYGLVEDSHLAGLLAVYYGRFDPLDRTCLPRTEKELCLQPASKPFDTLFLYNLEVEPTSRGRAHSRILYHTAMERAKSAGCRYSVACARIPSYAGSDPRFPQELVQARPALKEAIDRHFAGGEYPSHEQLLMDPLLNFYFRFGAPGNCKFHWIIPDFAPHDWATAGVRVILYGEMRDWPGEVNVKA